ncbi:MAG TPA: hypothetical protein DCM66_02425 [Erythrobacter sp.]|jgi:hypothetical protein|nr:hypothetical protein A3745_12080 [Erythrobacter sp. HI0074]KZZ04659.1 hypothetical protein A3748_06320 [Erythrobacter sp. HI0077]MAQ29831.1 hypothetical protein [Erythrobacter sp.]MBN91853.1 hypothetical protein [Erythrobacteraceae bacterium]HAL89520.1 hypothetical protein [Erythrobacter sp.]
MQGLYFTRCQRHFQNANLIVLEQDLVILGGCYRSLEFRWPSIGIARHVADIRIAPAGGRSDIALLRS